MRGLRSRLTPPGSLPRVRPLNPAPGASLFRGPEPVLEPLLRLGDPVAREGRKSRQLDGRPELPRRAAALARCAALRLSLSAFVSSTATGTARGSSHRNKVSSRVVTPRRMSIVTTSPTSDARSVKYASSERRQCACTSGPRARSRSPANRRGADLRRRVKKFKSCVRPGVLLTRASLRSRSRRSPPSICRSSSGRRTRPLGPCRRENPSGAQRSSRKWRSARDLKTCAVAA